MHKRDLRNLFVKKRALIAGDKKAELDLIIKENFFRHIKPNTKCVHVYLPIHSKNEVDTWPIIQELWSRKITVAVPVIDVDKEGMLTCQVQQGTELKENNWDISEPIKCKKVQKSIIDAIVLPLLAYDTNGFRVGYGKAYYDNYLSSLNKGVVKVGLSYFPPVEEIIDVDSWDVRMDFCITPEKVFKF